MGDIHKLSTIFISNKIRDKDFWFAITKLKEVKSLSFPAASKLLMDLASIDGLELRYLPTIRAIYNGIATLLVDPDGGDDEDDIDDRDGGDDGNSEDDKDGGDDGNSEDDKDGATVDDEVEINLSSIRGPNNNSLLHLSVKHSNFPMMWLLLEKDDEVNPMSIAINNQGLLPVDLSPTEDVTKFFLETKCLMDALHGNYPALIYAIRKGVSATVEDSHGNNIFHYFAMKDKPAPESKQKPHKDDLDKVVRILTKHGADINKQNYDGKTPIYTAMESFNTGAIEALLKGGADENIVDVPRELPIKLLSPDEKHYFYTIKCFAELYRGNIEEVAHMIDLEYVSPKVVYPDMHHRGIMHYLAIHGKEMSGSEVPALCSRKVPVDAQDYYGNTPMHYAVERYIETAVLRRGLFDWGVKILPNVDGLTPYDLCPKFFRNEFAAVIIFFASLRRDYNLFSEFWPKTHYLLINKDGCTALHNIIDHFNPENAISDEDAALSLRDAREVIAKYPTSLDQENSERKLPSHSAGERGAGNILELIKATRKDTFWIKDTITGNTPVHWCIKGLHHMRHLGINVQQMYIRAIAVIISALPSIPGFPNIIDPYDIEIPNKHKHSPMHLAALYGLPEVIGPLSNSGASVIKHAIYSGNFPLHYAILGMAGQVPSEFSGYNYRQESDHERMARYYDTIEKIIEIHPSSTAVNVQRYDFKTPLHLAAIYGLSLFFRLLLERGADPNTKDYPLMRGAEGKTPLQYNPDFKIILEEVNFLRDVYHVIINPEKEISILNSLISKIGDINCKSSSGKSAIHIIVTTVMNPPDDIEIDRSDLIQRVEKAIQIFANGGANLNAQDKYGNTPLHATISPKVDADFMDPISKILLTCGADPTIKNDEGTSFDSSLGYCTRSDKFMNWYEKDLDPLPRYRSKATEDDATTTSLLQLNDSTSRGIPSILLSSVFGSLSPAEDNSHNALPSGKQLHTFNMKASPPMYNVYYAADGKSIHVFFDHHRPAEKWDSNTCPADKSTALIPGSFDRYQVNPPTMVTLVDSLPYFYVMYKGLFDLAKGIYEDIRYLFGLRTSPKEERQKEIFEKIKKHLSNKLANTPAGKLESSDDLDNSIKALKEYSFDQIELFSKKNLPSGNMTVEQIIKYICSVIYKMLENERADKVNEEYIEAYLDLILSEEFKDGSNAIRCLVGHNNEHLLSVLGEELFWTEENAKSVEHLAHINKSEIGTWGTPIFNNTVPTLCSDIDVNYLK